MRGFHGLTLAACSSIISAMAIAQPVTGDRHTSLLEVPVADMKVVAPDAYGSALSLAAGGASPLDIALAIAGEFEGTTQHIVQANEGGEVPSSTKITVLRDGLLDDAVRGERWDIALDRTAAGIWGIREVKRSWRCRRGAQMDRFAAQVCP
ncbi:hypothetical protein [Microvirga sp. VF16]|uniref:hypothetical protein n=1 Tax=Microvirga sp. VF16 TaxID=2807101 RepID=UPI00193E54A3|nr:hypothetical protein [Microvirga sp. VF16]QRM30690.1 hypothetical protein JO965_06735 [Microvirga sp. VF16]